MLNQTDLAYLENFKNKHTGKNCPICKGKGIFCFCTRAYNHEMAKCAANFPLKYRRYTLENFTHPDLAQQKNKITKYIQNIDRARADGSSLYLHGDGGTGKTMSALLILDAAIQNKNWRCYYFSGIREAIEVLKNEWENRENSSEDSPKDKVRSILSDYDFIIIDDFGMESFSISPATTGLLMSAMKMRSNNMLPTIFISAHEIKDIPGKFEQELIRYFMSDITEVNFRGFNYTEEVLKRAKGWEK